jgi:hypothetical protein
MATPPQEVESGLAAFTSPPPRDYTDFAEIWPSVFTSTVQRLLARGVGAAVAEDAAQEAGTRALAMHVPFTDAGDLTRWVSTVAWRIAVDEHRHHGRRVVAAPVRDRAADIDVATEAEARLELRRVSLAWPRLSEGDRAALVDPRPDTGDRRAAVRSAVRRHRARMRLVALIEALGAIALAPLSRLRRPVVAVALMGTVPLAAAMLVHIDRGGAQPPARVVPDAGPSRTIATTTVAAVDAGDREEDVRSGSVAVGRSMAVATPDPQDEPSEPVVDVGVEAEVRPRDARDDAIVCVRFPTAVVGAGERCVESIGDDLELSHLDDPLG